MEQDSYLPLIANTVLMTGEIVTEGRKKCGMIYTLKIILHKNIK